MFTSIHNCQRFKMNYQIFGWRFTWITMQLRCLRICQRQLKIQDPIILEWEWRTAKIVNGMTAGKSWLLNQKEDDRWPLTAPKKKVRVSRFEDRDRRHTRHGHWLLKEQGHRGPPSNWTSCKTISLGKKNYFVLADIVWELT